ncbi:hypothetical protein MLD38_023166 [Melastoma candidum]|uniref:Uncharacterized protein n=1 Tax=Melastoma candidum TaxID=119954 RepID=A0ACB9QMU0_9MYRT|nr:hypothetical protein MLD38_023166 [Melastoma candidum]
MGLASILTLVVFAAPFFLSRSDGFDVLDPNGNITIKWDVMAGYGDKYDAKVWIFNYQLFRHIELPGWRLSFKWPEDEVIWNMQGAEATLQGNCSRFTGFRPHSCEKKPVLIDLLPAAPFKLRSANCCKGGVLSTHNQNPDTYGASFELTVGVGTTSDAVPFPIPDNFTLGVPGYTCSPPFNVTPSKYSEDSGRRWTQAISTWEVTCVYSQFRAWPTPRCCVSLSSFYDSTIVPCPKCSCNCQGLPGARCVNPGETPPILQLPHGTLQEPTPVVRCSQHMCPVRVHWHVKQSYREYWRAKLTITNMNFAKNYTQWNIVMQHPNLQNITQVFSFNYHPLNQHGTINDTGMFWGIQFYNDMLLQSGDYGNVQTEILLNKDPKMFTFSEGWAFPRKISFNGEQCVMPSLEDYPRLPKTSATTTAASTGDGLWIVTILVTLAIVSGL